MLSSYFVSFLFFSATLSSSFSSSPPSLKIVRLCLIDRMNLRVYTRFMEKSICIVTSLRRAAAAATNTTNKILEASGLNVTMFRLLYICNNNPQASITELANLNGLDRTTIGRNLRVLEKQGFIECVTCHQDERERKVVLTKKGQQSLTLATTLWKESQQLLNEIMGEDDELILDYLKKFSKLT